MKIVCIAKNRSLFAVLFPSFPQKAQHTLRAFFYSSSSVRVIIVNASISTLQTNHVYDTIIQHLSFSPNAFALNFCRNRIRKTFRVYPWNTFRLYRTWWMRTRHYFLLVKSHENNISLALTIHDGKKSHHHWQWAPLRDELALPARRKKKIRTKRCLNNETSTHSLWLPQSCNKYFVQNLSTAYDWMSSVLLFLVQFCFFFFSISVFGERVIENHKEILHSISEL